MEKLLYMKIVTILQKSNYASNLYLEMERGKYEYCKSIIRAEIDGI